MPANSLAAVLEREHHDIDNGIEAFAALLAAGEVDAEPLRRAAGALRRHIYIEEALVFPPLRDAGLVAPVFVMLREHGQLWRTLDALDAELRLASDAPTLQKLCKELVVELQHHNPKEEQILYPQADQVLTALVNAQLRRFLDSGQMPDGWVCERA